LGVPRGRGPRAIASVVAAGIGGDVGVAVAVVVTDAVVVVVVLVAGSPPPHGER
jgi:Mg2+/Co2+ transporter CorB